MQLKDAIAALKTQIAGLAWPDDASKPLFSGVFTTTDPGPMADQLYPYALIRKVSGRPHGSNGDKLWVYQIAIEIKQEMLADDFGDGQVLNLNRDAVELSEGAGLAELETAVCRQTHYLDGDDRAGIRSYLRCLGSGSWQAVGDICSVVIEYEGTLRINSS